MKTNASDDRAQSRRQETLPSDVRVFVEAHLRDLAKAGRLTELARSRDALRKYYNVQGNDAAAYLIAHAPDFLLALTPGGGVTLTLPDGTDYVTWTQTELLQEQRDEVNEVENCAMQLAGGPDQFRALSAGEQEALTARAVEEVFKRLHGR